MSLNTIICEQKANLCVRLPLIFMEKILKRPPTVTELEFFAEKEDKLFFQSVHKCKDNNAMLEEAGYDSYDMFTNHM